MQRDAIKPREVIRINIRVRVERGSVFFVVVVVVVVFVVVFVVGLDSTIMICSIIISVYCSGVVLSDNIIIIMRY